MRKDTLVGGAMALILIILLWVAGFQEIVDLHFQEGYGTDYGIVASMDFEEGTGSITYDQSPYGNDGTITGATWAAGKYGMALTFDGNDFVTLSDSDSLDLDAKDNITIEAWAKDPPIPWGAELGGDFEIVGNAVVMNDTRAYLSAEPHTIGSSGWVEFTLISKQYSGDIDVVWGFDRTESRPRNPQVWANYSHTLYRWIEVELSFTNETGTHYYDSWVKEYYEEWFFDWKPLNKDFTRKLIDAKGMDTWYLLKKIYVDEDKEYKLRCWVEVPFAGNDIIQGKYAWGVKLSSDTIQQAITANRFYFMDPWYNALWLYRVKITVDSGDVGSVLTDFPVMVYLNSTRISWAYVQDDLDDLRFTSNDGVTLLSYEIEGYTTNVDAWLWVKLPTISNTTDTEFFLYYGNVAAASGEDKTGTWNTDYVMVQHMVDDPDTSHITDSTQYNNDGTKEAANEPQEVVGYISDAEDFDGSDDYIDFGANGLLDAAKSFTFEVFLRPLLVFSGHEGIFTIGSTNQRVPWIWGFANQNYIDCQFETTAQPGVDGHGRTLNLDSMVYNYVVFTWNGSFIQPYLNCTAGGTTDTTIGDTMANSDANMFIGRLIGFDNLTATVDELRVSNVSRSLSWIEVSYESERDHLLTYSSEAVYKVIVEKHDSYTLAIEDTDTLLGKIGAIESTFTIDTPLEWHYYAMTHDGANIRLYIDGVLVATTACAIAIPTNNEDVFIGHRFLGEIDQVRIYDECKTLGEIKNHYLNSGHMYSRSVVVSDDYRILNSTLAEELQLNEYGLDLNQNYLLNTLRENWLYFDTTAGNLREHVFHLQAGSTTQDRHIAKVIAGVHPAPGGGKWLNVSISDGTNTMWINMTGATTYDYTTTGAFDLDVSAETLDVIHDHTAGGAVDHVNIVVQWYYIETP